MFVHIFLFRWKPEVTAADKERAAREIVALKESIGEVVEVQVGHNQSPRGQGYAFGGLMKFESERDFQLYERHPAHQALLEWLVPMIEPLELDFAA